MKKAVLIMLALMSSLISAQNLQNANWLFGEYAGLNFNTTPPTPLLPSTATGSFQPEGNCASISAPDGTLMFYTDSNKVWNKNHQVMPNGTGLFGSVVASQNVVIIPKPGDNYRFYLVNLDGFMGTQQGLTFSEVDMTLNGGLGDVIASTKNTVLNDHMGTPINLAYGNLSHRITYYPHANGNDYWLITQINQYVFSHLVTDAGITANAVQASLAPIATTYNQNGTGQMKVSPDGTKIGMGYTANPSGTGSVFLGSFNNTTGAVVMNTTDLLLPTAWGWIWGLEFSPNSQVMYYANEATIYSYDIATGQTHTVTTTADADPNMQLAIDGKIYITTYVDKLSVIDNPNVFGAGCNYQYLSVSLNGRVSGRGLPAWVHWQNQKLWPRTFASTFQRTEPRDIQTDAAGNTYYVGSINAHGEPLNVVSNEDHDYIIPYGNEHLLPGFNPANYSQPQFSFSQLYKFDKFGNMLWHKALNYLWDQIHIRKTNDRIYIYKDSGSLGDPYIKEVISLNNGTIMPPYTHNWGMYNGLDQNGHEIYVRQLGTNSFLVTLINPTTNSTVLTIPVNLAGTPLANSPWLKIGHIANYDYIFTGEYHHPCPTPPCSLLSTVKTVHTKRSGNNYVLSSSILYSYTNTVTAFDKQFQHLFFSNRLFLGFFNDNIYETPPSTTSAINAEIKVFAYSPGTLTPTGTTITTPGDYLYTMSTANNRILFVGHRRLYAGTGSTFTPTPIMSFPSGSAGKVATYDAVGNVLVAGKYWRPVTFSFPSVSQPVFAYGGFSMPSDPYATSSSLNAGHHFVTKLKPASGGGYEAYRPIVVTDGKEEIVAGGSDETLLYPNPVIRELTVQVAAAYTSYEVYTVDGKLMENGAVTAEEPLKIDVSGYAKGNYFIKLFNDKGEQESMQFLKM